MTRISVMRLGRPRFSCMEFNCTVGNKNIDAYMHRPFVSCVTHIYVSKTHQGLIRTLFTDVSHRPGFCMKPQMPCFCNNANRHFSTFAGSSLKGGMIFLHGDKYCEVVSNRQVKQGRGSASLQVEYVELPSRKPMTLNLPIGAKVDKVELEKHSALVQYLDEDARELVVSDQNFEEKRIPSSIIGDGVKLLEAGDELQLFYHNETIVKISLPNTINSRLKKK